MIRRMRAVRLFARCLLVLTCVPVSGCWDRIELQEMSIIMGIGVDLTADKATRVTAQIIHTSGSGPSKGNPQEEKSSYLLLEEQAPTLEEAMQKFFGKSARRMFFSHIAIIVFGADFARQGIGQALDYFERNRDFRRAQLLAVTDQRAGDVFRGRTGVESVNASGIQEIILNQTNAAVSLASSQLQFDNDYLAPSHTPVVSWIATNEKKEVFAKGVAVFQGDKLSLLLPKTDSRGVLWFLGKVKRAQLEIPCTKPKADGSMIEVSRIDVKVTPRSDEKTRFQVTVKGEGEIKKLCSSEQITDNTLRKMEAELGEAIHAEMDRSLSVLRRNRADAVHFADKLFDAHPLQWRKMADGWTGIFAKTEADYVISVKINRSGMNSRPLPQLYKPGNEAPKPDGKDRKP